MLYGLKLKIVLMILYAVLIIVVILFPVEAIGLVTMLITTVVNYYVKDATIAELLFKLLVTILIVFGLIIMFRGTFYRIKLSMISFTKNTYSYGKARFANKREIKKAYLSVKEGSEYHHGYLVGEYQEISILGHPVKWRPFFNFEKQLSKEYMENLLFSNDVIDSSDEDKLLKIASGVNNMRNINFNKIPGIKYTNYYQVITEPMNMIISAVTRSGKTVCQVIPQLLYFAKLKDEKQKPLVVITDPKGELWKKTAGHMQQGGYECIRIDLTNIEESGSFNTFEKVYDIYNLILKANDICIKDENIENQEFKETDYVIEVGDAVSLREIIEERKIDLSRVEDELIRLAAPLYPMETEGQNAIFTQMSNHLFVSLTYFLLEDCYANNRKDLFSIYNLFYKQKQLLKMVQIDFQDVIRYKATLSNYPEHNLAKSYYPSELTDKTFSSTQITFETGLKIFGADSVSKITSSSSMSITEFVKGDKPVAFYLIAPDYDTKYHSIITTFISQVYYEAVSYADKQPSGKLPRRLYYILEEFGNVSKIEGFPNWLTISLGRDILFSMILQNVVGQLEQVYGEQAKDTILDQSHVKMYLLSNDTKTLNYFSELFGKTTKVKHSYQGRTYKDMSKTSKEEEESLLRPEELRMTPMGVGYVLKSRTNPSKQVFRPSFTYLKPLEYVATNDSKTYLDELIF